MKRRCCEKLNKVATKYVRNKLVLTQLAPQAVACQIIIFIIHTIFCKRQTPLHYSLYFLMFEIWGKTHVHIFNSGIQKGSMMT